MTGTPTPAPNPPGAAATPWTMHHDPRDESYELLDAGGGHIELVLAYANETKDPDYQALVEAQARYIVTTVNSFGPLVEALARYGRHTSACAPSRIAPCTCGWSEIRSAYLAGAQPGRAGAVLGEGERP